MARGELGAHPPAAAAAGYHMHTLGPQGFNDTTKWKVWTYFGWTPDQAEFNADGSVTINNNSGASTALNAGLATATPTGASTPLFSKGIGFGGGGYFEAEMRWTPAYSGSVTGTLNGNIQGWPSFWSLPIEQNNSVSPYGIHWPGQAGTEGDVVNSYNHTCEIDFCEYQGDPTRYGSSQHDYYNTPPSRQTINPTNAVPKTIPPGGVDFTQFHKIAFLWIPATATPTVGSGQMYFDDVAMGSPVNWDLNTDATNPPPPVQYPAAGTHAGSILDKRHLFLILGNTSQAQRGMQMIVRQVNVWQKNATNNIVVP